MTLAHARFWLIKKIAGKTLGVAINIGIRGGTFIQDGTPLEQMFYKNVTIIGPPPLQRSGLHTFDIGGVP